MQIVEDHRCSDQAAADLLGVLFVVYYIVRDTVFGVMETFKNISWNVPVESETDCATADEFKSQSVTYKILHGTLQPELSSDSSDEPVYVKKSPPKKTSKKKKTKKNKKVSSGTECKSAEEAVLNEDGVRYSSLSAAQHASYVDILRTVQLQRTAIPPEKNKMKEAVEKEQLEFLEHIRELWKIAYEKHNVLVEGARKFTEDEWKSQLKRVKSYPQYYTLLRKVPLVYPEDKPEVQMVPLQMLLEMGVVPVLHVPAENLSSKVSTDYSKMLLLNAPCPDDATTLLHLPVSADKNAEILAVKERADIVISSSSLKCIADNISSKFDRVWNIPVVVKQYRMKGGNSLKHHKVVYMDKRLPSKTMSTSERNAWFHKLAVKCFMCNHRDVMAFRYSENQLLDINVEFTNENEEKPQNNIQNTSTNDFCAKCKLPRRKSSEDCMDSDGSELLIDTDDEDISKTCVCDEEMEIQEGEDKSSTTQNNTYYTAIRPSSKTNVTYRLWKLNCGERNKEDLNEKFLKGQNSPKELRVLVRCKVDACEHENNQVSPVCVSCKLEYQAEYGAEKINVSSLVREWTSLFFRPEAALRRIRIDALTEEVIMTEKNMLRDLAQMALHLYNLRIRRTVLGSLYQVMKDIVTLKPGYFLLSHDHRNGPFTCVLQHTNTYSEYDLYTDFKSVNPALVQEDHVPQWTPIDTNLVTQKHIASKRIPATFQPLK